MKATTKILLYLAAVLLIATGFCDLDAEFMAQRFSEYFRSVDFWEFAPYLKMNWHLAYVFSLGRIVAGCLILGYLLGKERDDLKP